MSKIIPIIGFGVGLICLGFYFQIYNDVYTMFISKYVLTDYYAFGVHYTSNKWHDFIYMVWRLIPWLCVLLGAFLLLIAGDKAIEDSGVQQ